MTGKSSREASSREAEHPTKNQGLLELITIFHCFSNSAVQNNSAAHQLSSWNNICNTICFIESPKSCYDVPSGFCHLNLSINATCSVMMSWCPESKNITWSIVKFSLHEESFPSAFGQAIVQPLLLKKPSLMTCQIPDPAQIWIVCIKCLYRYLWIVCISTYLPTH